METIELKKLEAKCPGCGSDKIVYSCDPECCFNHVCESCLTTFEIGTIVSDHEVIKGDFKLPERDITEPTTGCDACGSIDVFSIYDNEYLVCAECGNLLQMEYTDIQRQ